MMVKPVYYLCQHRETGRWHILDESGTMIISLATQKEAMIHLDNLMGYNTWQFGVAHREDDDTSTREALRNHGATEVSVHDDDE